MSKRKRRLVRQALVTLPSGRRVDVLSFGPGDVDLRDVATSLGRMPRFNGMTARRPYTVAQHCVLMSTLFDDPVLRAHALLHDAAEAYVGDVVWPVKRILGDAWEAVERPVRNAILVACGLDAVVPEEISEADRRLAATEMRDLFERPISIPGVEPYPFSVRPWTIHDPGLVWLNHVEIALADVRRAS